MGEPYDPGDEHDHVPAPPPIIVPFIMPVPLPPDPHFHPSIATEPEPEPEPEPDPEPEPKSMFRRYFALAPALAILLAITATGQGPGYKVNIVATGGAKYVVIDPSGREVSSHSTQHAAEAVAIAGSLNDGGRTYFVRQSLELRVSATGPVAPPQPPVDPPVEPEPPVEPVEPEEPEEPTEPEIPPPVEPLPEDSRILPVILPDGTEWWGLTNAPPTTFRTDHPRIWVTPETLPALRQKLAHPAYSESVAKVRASTNASDKAFCYLIWGDKAKGQEAIAALLAWKQASWGGLDSRADQLQGVLMYDWLHNLMTSQQREDAQRVILANLSLGPPSTEYWHSTEWHYLGSWEVIAALGLDNQWAIDRRAETLNPDSRRFKVYRGALDILTQSSLQEGGGWHAGNHGHAFTGYETGYSAQGGPLVLKAWETATGQSVLDQTTYFDRMPYATAKTRWRVQAGSSPQGLMALEYCTGNSNPESAQLAKWMLEKWGSLGDRDYALPVRMILGDLRVEAKSPQDLGIPLYGYVDGQNCVYARSGWDDSATCFLFFARCWDRARYEQGSTHLVIYKNGLPVLPISTNYKGIGHQPFTQLRVWDGDAAKRWQRSSYWAPTKGRASKAEDVITKLHHRPETLTHLSENNGVVTATCRFDHLLLVNAPLAQRTVVIDPQAEMVMVTDQVELSPGLMTESNFGLTEAPVITDNVIENSVVRITVSTPFEEIVWDTTEYENDTRGYQHTIGTVKIRPVMDGNKSTCQTLVEVK